MIKQIVKWTIISGGALSLVVLLAGLAIPQSVLVKLSKKQTSNGVVESKLNDTTNNKQQATQSQSSAALSQQSDSGAVQTSTPQTSTQSIATTNSAGPSAPTNTPTASTTPTAPPATVPPTTTTVNVAPILNFSASPSSITSGSGSTLSWSINSGATPAVTCTASGAWSGGKATSGSLGVTPGSTSTYSLACSNTAGTSAQSASITVTPAPVACGSAGGGCTTGQIAVHNTAADCWVIYNANYLILSGSGVVGSNGNEVSNHSGGASRITPYCGANASAAFTSAHGGQTAVKSIFNSYIVGPVN
jgi:hypothetical protein